MSGLNFKVNVALIEEQETKQNCDFIDIFYKTLPGSIYTYCY